jgi:N-acetylmuramoyl-L-alanine amidase
VQITCKMGNIDHPTTPVNRLLFNSELGNIVVTMETIKLSPESDHKESVHSGRILQTTLSVALLFATIFTAFPPTLLTSDFNERLSLLLTPQPEPISTGVPSSQEGSHIGIISGHWGYDSGTVCPNGVTEEEVNLKIATIVQQQLNSEKKYQVDLLQETDVRLNGYQGVVLVSIHNDSCVISNELTSGFKIAPSSDGVNPGEADRLANCIHDRYQKETNLPYHAGSITPDMTAYHVFREINAYTAAVIIETGFLSNPVDYALLTNDPTKVATGIVKGILCYLNNEAIDPTATPAVNP